MILEVSSPSQIGVTAAGGVQIAHFWLWCYLDGSDPFHAKTESVNGFQGFLLDITCNVQHC